MFDQNNTNPNQNPAPMPNQNPTPPLNQNQNIGGSRGQVEDIFSSTDKASPNGLNQKEKPDVFKPKAAHDANQAGESGDKTEKKNKKLLFLGGIGLVLILLLAGGWYIYSSLFSSLGNIQDAGMGSFVDETDIIDNQNDNLEEEPEQFNENFIEEVLNDSDNDGLTNEEELAIGTDPNLVDTDGDSLSDREELEVYKTNPLNMDSDNDGYTDGEEIDMLRNPNGDGALLQVPEGTIEMNEEDTILLVDSDEDKLLDDEEEMTYGTDPLNSDTDGDGLDDYEELKVYKTDPLNPDTDKDGYLDGEEVQNGYNPAGDGKL